MNVTGAIEGLQLFCTPAGQVQEKDLQIIYANKRERESNEYHD